MGAGLVGAVGSPPQQPGELTSAACSDAKAVRYSYADLPADVVRRIFA